MRRRTTIVILMVWVLVAGGVVLAGCGQPDTAAKDAGTRAGSPSGIPSTVRPSADDSTAVPTPTPEIPLTVDEFARICRGGAGFSGVAPYTRTPGIHPMVQLAWSPSIGAMVDSFGLDPDWTIKRDKYGRPRKGELARVELVTCLETLSVHPTGETCVYDDGRVRMRLFAAEDRYTVHEARTGRQLATRRFFTPGTAACPWSAMYTPGQKRLVEGPDGQRVRDFLAQFAERPRAGAATRSTPRR